MDINNAFPSDHLKASDLQGREVTVVMSHVEVKEIGGDTKPVLAFQGKEKTLVLNKTNANCISQMYGTETSAWAGKTIVLFPSQTDFQGKVVPCIRVKLQTPNEVSAAPAVAESAGSLATDLDDSIPF